MKPMKVKDWVILFIFLICVPIGLVVMFGGKVADAGYFLLYIVFTGIMFYVPYSGLKHKNLLTVINISISAVLVISMGVFSYSMDWFSQSISILSLFLFSVFTIINFFSIFINWKKSVIKSFVPIMITIITIPLIGLSVQSGNYANIYVFKKRLPQYEKAVKEIESQLSDEKVRLTGDKIPQEYRSLARHIIGEKIGTDAYAVTFIWGISFPVEHSGYAYISNGNLPEKGTEFRRYWPHVKRINDKWFKVRD